MADGGSTRGPNGHTNGVTITGGPGSRSERHFIGTGFGSLTMRTPEAEVIRATPEVISRRGILRFGLPGVYQESDFSMRFVGALEEVLDPIGATLDSLHHYLDADFAPRGVLELVCAWLGVETDEAMDTDELRRLARHAAELGRRRGTVRGLELALALAFPELPLRVEDGGGIAWPGSSPLEGPGSHFVVYCDRHIPEEQQVEVARCIEREKPVHASYRLRVKAKKKAT